MVAATRVGTFKYYDAVGLTNANPTQLAAMHADWYAVIKQTCIDAGFVITVGTLNTYESITVTPPWEAPIPQDTPSYVVGRNGGKVMMGTATSQYTFNPVIESPAYDFVAGAFVYTVADAQLGFLWSCLVWLSPTTGNFYTDLLLRELVVCTYSQRLPEDQSLPASTGYRYGYFSNWDSNFKLFNSTTSGQRPAMVSRLQYSYPGGRGYYYPRKITGISPRLSAPINLLPNSSNKQVIYGELVGVRHTLNGDFANDCFATGEELVVVNGENYAAFNQYAPPALLVKEFGNTQPYPTPSSSLLLASSIGFTSLGMFP